MDTKLSGTEISKLTAALTGGGFKRANSKEAAIARFIKIATEKGFDKPEQYLAMSADDATQALFSNRPKKKSVHVDDLHKSDHPIVKANAASRNAVTKPGKRKAAKMRPWPAMIMPPSSTRIGFVQPHSRMDAAI